MEHQQPRQNAPACGNPGTRGGAVGPSQDQGQSKPRRERRRREDELIAYDKNMQNNDRQQGGGNTRDTNYTPLFAPAPFIARLLSASTLYRLR